MSLTHELLKEILDELRVHKHPVFNSPQPYTVLKGFAYGAVHTSRVTGMDTYVFTTKSTSALGIKEVPAHLIIEEKI